jgi:tRNA(Ile)-lysidine synthase
VPSLPELILAALRGGGSPGAGGNERDIVLLACSGGMDSQVLLHAASSVLPRERLVVAHVHHGLQPQAEAWLDFCGQAASEAGLPFLSRRLPPMPTRPRGGIEAWARAGRYRALLAMADEAGAVFVMTAHHAGDQLETHHLQRTRGAGVHGLAAMRQRGPLPAGTPPRDDVLLLRPFLSVGRSHLAEYAAAHRLDWVEDPSNQDLRYARNRVRRQLADAIADDPDLLARGLARIGELQALAEAARRQARQDLEACRLHLAAPRSHAGVAATGIAGPGAGATGVAQPAPAILSRAALARLPADRAAEALRLWIAGLGCQMPSRARLAEIRRQLVDAASSQARLRHDGRWLLRYRDRIDAATELPAVVRPVWFRWAGEPMLDMAGERFLFRRAAQGEAGLPASILSAADLLLDQGRSSDRIRLGQGGHRRTWRNLCQEAGIAPWARAALPVVRQGKALVFAAPFGTAADPSVQEASDPPPPRADLIAIQWVPDPSIARWL